MAKKQPQTEAGTEVNEAPLEEQFPAEEESTGDPSDVLGEMDFNVNDEYKPDPLIPGGTYHGVITKATFIPSKYNITFDWCLHDNGGVMSDNETPIDGAHVMQRIWLPKPGDEQVMTTSGKATKHQSKINMMKAVQDDLGIDMSTPQIIATSLMEAAWVGVEGDVDVTVDEYLGRFRNSVNRSRQSKMY